MRQRRSERGRLIALPLAVGLELASLAGCERSLESQPSTPGGTEATLMLGEPFAIGEAQCRVQSAHPTLTEARGDGATRRVAPDVHALALALDCRDGQGRGIATHRALPRQSVILLITAEGERIAPSTRTWLSAQQPDRLIFELPAAASAVSPTRRFDTQTGTRKGHAAERFGQLHIESTRQRAQVLLRARTETQAFEIALDALLRSLAEDVGEPPALASAARAHRAMREATGARSMVAGVSPSAQAAWPLTLTYDVSRNAAHGLSRRTLRLALAPLEAAQPLRILSVEDLPEVERTLACSHDQRILAARAGLAYEGRPPGPDCHVMGLLVPGPCETSDGSLVARALDVMGRCIEPKALRARHPPPADFQLTLRRGRSGSALDRAPRYIVSLFAEGAVVFHGLHWVNSVDRSDGRADPHVLGGLYDHMHGLAWFDRRGGEWSDEACRADRDRGTLITLRAGGRERMVLDREGCRGPFSAQELDEVRRLVEAVAGLQSHTTVRPAYADAHARVWTVE